MHRLIPEKLVTIITNDVLEHQLIKSVRKNGASGYTIVHARGAGSSGEQSGMLNIDTNIKFHVILPQERLTQLLDDLDYLIHKGHHLTVYVSDVSVLDADKFKKPMT
jgi:hypothetical protein